MEFLESDIFPIPELDKFHLVVCIYKVVGYFFIGEALPICEGPSQWSSSLACNVWIVHIEDYIAVVVDEAGRDVHTWVSSG